VCFIVHKTTSEVECAILTTMYFGGAENTDSWCTSKGDLQRGLPLDVPMVHSSALTISTDGERWTCSGFSLREITGFGSLEFIADCFGGLSLSPMRNDLGAAFMGLTHSLWCFQHWVGSIGARASGSGDI
jgi:hypothetical protein